MKCETQLDDINRLEIQCQQTISVASQHDDHFESLLADPCSPEQQRTKWERTKRTKSKLELASETYTSQPTTHSQLHPTSFALNTDLIIIVEAKEYQLNYTHTSNFRRNAVISHILVQPDI